MGVKAPITNKVLESYFTQVKYCYIGISQEELTGNSENNDFLVGPFFGGIVGNGHTTRSNVALFLGIGDVATVVLTPFSNPRINEGSMMCEIIGAEGWQTHEKTTSEGKLSPDLRTGILKVYLYGLGYSEIGRMF